MKGMLDKSVIILTTERGGCAWMSAIISEVHRQMYDVPVFWDYEISRVIATDEKYFLPRAHTSVYYIKLEWLLKRDYDKIIVLRRDLDTFKKAMYNYYLPELSESEIIEQYPEWIKEMEFYHDLVFGAVIEDPRVLYVELSDLNNYTITEFSRVLDFLGYPIGEKPTKLIVNALVKVWIDTMELLDRDEKIMYLTTEIYEYFQSIQYRPCLIPIKTELRDWEVSASILSKGIMIGDRSKNMLKYSNKEVLAPIERPELQKHPEMTPYNCMKSTGQHTSLEKANPYKMSPEEWKHQTHQVFRVKPEGMHDTLKILGVIKNV